MTKLSGMNFSNTNRLHFVLVIGSYFDNNLNYPQSIYKQQDSWSNKNHLTITQSTKYVQNQVQLYISNRARNIQILVIPFSFYNLKLRTEAIID